jgi:serine/threonine protein kinase
MIAGARPFRGDSAADTMSAILREDPPELSVTNPGISPGLARVVQHCLEKNPEQRFQSAYDLAFDLEALSTTSATRVEPLGTRGPRGLFRARFTVLLGALALAAGLLGGWLLGKPGPGSPVTYHRALCPSPARIISQRAPLSLTH